MKRTGVDLGPLDPERKDPGYWDRFHARVMSGAAPLLKRRRTTMSGVMSAWSRLIMPAAAMAAAAAGFVFFQPFAGPSLSSSTDGLMTTGGITSAVVEEVGIQPLYTVPDPMPGVLVADEDLDLRALLFTLDEF